MLTVVEPPRRLLASRPRSRRTGGLRLLPTRSRPAPGHAADQPGGVWQPQPARADVDPRPTFTARIAHAVALRPGWPLRYLLVGYPIWWALGLGPFVFAILAVPMLIELRRRWPIRLPPAFSLWALFLAWQFLSLAMFGASPPGTHATSAAGRLISIAFSIGMFFVVTVVLLYVGNLPRALVPTKDIARWMGAFFLTVVAGGYLGLVAPHLSFRSPVELLLPHGLTSNSYVRVLVHPVAAQVQAVIGTATGRPAAPFGYTNTWGNVISILLVWFVASWLVPARGGRRVAYIALAVASFVPIVLSLDRGLWIGLIVTVLWLGMRQLYFGRIGVVLAGLGATALGAVALLVSPLYSVIGARLHNGDSNNIRAFVLRQSIKAIKYSPIIGYGGTRHTNGSSSSIAVGPSSSCGGCGDFSTGSTGQLWSIMFNQGLGGVLFYFGFFAVAVWIYRRQRGAIAEAALATVALVFVYMLFYSEVPVTPTLTMVAVGVLWREHRAGTPPGAATGRGARRRVHP